MEDPSKRAARLERGELLSLAAAPFPLPSPDDLALLFSLRLGRLSKNVTYNPQRDTLAGAVLDGPPGMDHLLPVFRTFSAQVTTWLGDFLPGYRGHLTPDRATFHPEEEATRQLRQTARNDLLHIDAFPTRPSGGRRILRVFANVNPSESRVWVTTEPFARLLPRHGPAAGLPGQHPAGWLEHLGEGVLSLFRPGQARRSAYDGFMLRLHDHLKLNEQFQDRAPKKRWVFPPASAWLAMTDACTYAVLRGRFALEHSFFVDAAGLAVPEESPEALLRRFCQEQTRGHAA